MKRTTRTQMPQVAVLLESSHGISRAMLQGILNYVRVYGPWSLNIAAGGTNDLKVPDTRLWQGTGIIGRVTTNTIARDILACRLPCVLFNPDNAYLKASHPLSTYSRTQSDSPAIGRLAAEYYLGRTFQNFAFVGAASGINWSLWRGEAFVARLANAGKDCHVYPLPAKQQGEWEIERPRLCAWLKRLPKPVAVFVANDNRARQVLDACLVAEIGVPYEAAVLGVNNDKLICETCIPPLSSIALNAEMAGYEAARILDELMRQPGAPQQIVSYGTVGVVSRASTETLQLTDRLVIRALEFIRINNGLTIRVSDVAATLGVSSRWAEIRFQHALGCSIQDAIHRQRMTTICTMLRESDLPFNQISKRCGFSQAHHLCTLFKKHFGQTMSAYRTQHGNTQAGQLSNT